MLPESLLCLISATLAFAQARQQLTLDSVASFNTLRLNPPSFSIPQEERLAVSIALCSVTNSQPRFFVSNISNSDAQSDPGPAGGTSVFEIKLVDGLGSWAGGFPNGGLLSVQSSDADGFSFDVGLSTNTEPLHQNITLPFLGDTTSNQAIILSAPFAKFDIPVPSYPNYTLPAANMSQPPPPSSTPNMTLIVTETSRGITGGPRTGCFLSSQTTAGAIDEQTIWARDISGYRSQWLLSGLTPSTNYTAFVVQDSTKPPLSAHSCTLSHSVLG
ncbi:hypothetical protein NLJ89_g9583 [Agrocybe chaxingu]|uniref:Fibronectin type-III domain-containing protein n=1 Tax=Agrocybe chaxingu TaxID=84603 RepID=A0A9W8MPQ6_9AGAR|nr:hypothetical protein NLJ89_g9583 [Agrocybe chaxingu]